MQSLIDLYNQASDSLCCYSAPVLNNFRSQAAEQIAACGLPTRHTEGYRHIDLSKPFAIDYGVNIKQLALPTSGKPIRCDVKGINPILCWVVNGKIELPQNIEQYGIEITTLRSMSNAERLTAFDSLTASSNDPMVAFNAMFAQDGLLISIPDNLQLELPIQIMNIQTAEIDLMTAMHHYVLLGENAKAQILVCDHAYESNHYLLSSTTHVSVGKNAVYEHYHLEDTSEMMCRLSNLIVEQKEGSKVLTNLITLRNGTTRNNTYVYQSEQGCTTDLCGMFVGAGKQTTDNFTKIYHNSTNGRSNELFKYVLDEQSRGIFKGELIVALGAQKTEAYQTNRNILLSSKAKVRTEPQLEIYADDVKCSHGATTGQLDEAALFYLRQRGIPEHEARLLLMNAFVADVISNIRIESLRERIRLLTDNRLRNDNGGPCGKCQVCR